VRRGEEDRKNQNKDPSLKPKEGRVAEEKAKEGKIITPFPGGLVKV